MSEKIHAIKCTCDEPACKKAKDYYALLDQVYGDPHSNITLGLQEEIRQVLFPKTEKETE
jgi:hypothetical protein